MRSEIIVIRHGLTTGNLDKLYYGATDVPLAEEGKAALREQRDAGIYPYKESADFYTSGMLRTEQTLDIIYGSPNHKAIPELRELDFGDFEMKHYSELEGNPEYVEWLNANDKAVPPPNGESVHSFVTRISEGFEILKNYHAMKCFQQRHREAVPMTICVCHGGPISVIMDLIWPGRYENFYQWIPDPGHGYILKLKDGKVVDAEKF